MNNTTNRLGGATSAPISSRTEPQEVSEAGHRPKLKLAKIDTLMIDHLIECLVQNAAADNDPQTYLEVLLELASLLVFVLEAEEELLNLPPSIEGRPRPAETKLYPPKLSPFPSWQSLSTLDRSEQERLLNKRARELMQEIEGLRPGLCGASGGYYAVPSGRDAHRMIEQARRRFRRLRDTAMKLGHWTEGRWDAGEEETHLV